MSVPMCTDVETSISIKISHWPTSFPMLQDTKPTKPLEKLISADLGTDVAECPARSAPSKRHIGRGRYRCCKMPGVPLQDLTSADVGTDVNHLGRSIQNYHIGRCRCRCVPDGSISPGSPHRPMSVPMCTIWIDLPRNNSAKKQHGPKNHKGGTAGPRTAKEPQGGDRPM